MLHSWRDAPTLQTSIGQLDVGERGLQLSGGQKQRVALARVLLLQTPIVDARRVLVGLGHGARGEALRLAQRDIERADAAAHHPSDVGRWRWSIASSSCRGGRWLARR